MIIFIISNIICVTLHHLHILPYNHINIFSNLMIVDLITEEHWTRMNARLFHPQRECTRWLDLLLTGSFSVVLTVSMASCYTYKSQKNFQKNFFSWKKYFCLHGKVDVRTKVRNFDVNKNQFVYPWLFCIEDFDWIYQLRRSKLNIRATHLTHIILKSKTVSNFSTFFYLLIMTLQKKHN